MGRLGLLFPVTKVTGRLVTIAVPEAQAWGQRLECGRRARRPGGSRDVRSIVVVVVTVLVSLDSTLVKNASAIERATGTWASKYVKPVGCFGRFPTCLGAVDITSWGHDAELRSSSGPNPRLRRMVTE
ncbi:hypothetical protein L209DRAFT_196568 [Thermothelomyces heterothallicus CBS 203.75]